MTQSELNHLDFSIITTKEKIRELSQKGILEKVYLMPLEFGGEDIEHNYVFSPHTTSELKRHFDLMIEKLLNEGKELEYSVEPVYKGYSLIPSKLTITVTGEAHFVETINVW